TKMIKRFASTRNSYVIAILDSPCGHLSPCKKSCVHDHIDMKATWAVLQALRKATKASSSPPKPLDLILHTPGGDLSSALQIAWALASYPGLVTVFVPYWAYSAGTLISLAANKIVMDKNAVLGPIDAQITVPNVGGQDYTAAGRDLQLLLDSKPISSVADPSF